MGGRLADTDTIDALAEAGAVIRARRGERGLSQQALAEAAQVSRKFIVDLEAGHARASNPSPKHGCPDSPTATFGNP